MKDVPIGNVESQVKRTAEELEEQLTNEERITFDEWMRARWTEKDALLERYHEKGEFEGKSVEIVIGLNGVDDYVSAFSYRTALCVLT